MDARGNEPLKVDPIPQKRTLMKNNILLATSALLLAVCATAPKEAADLCDIKAAGLEACNGKAIQIQASVSNKGQQHPKISMDQKESYWDVNGSDWIFVSDKVIECRGRATFLGKLRTRVGPCKAKAKNHDQYCGTALYVKSWQCQ